MDLSKWNLNRDQYNILLDSSEFDCEFRELFLQLRLEKDFEPIEELFKNLLKDIRSLLERGFIEVVYIEYEEFKPKHIRDKFRKPLNFHEACKALEKPTLWLFTSIEAVDSLVLSTTPSGEELLDLIFDLEEESL